MVLLDVMLPDADGYALCRRLRDQQATSKARIIMVSAKAFPQEQAAGITAGADAYLTKPFDEDALRRHSPLNQWRTSHPEEERSVLR